MNRITPGVKLLLIINFAVFALTFVLNYFGIDFEHTLALYYFKSQNFKPLQYITYMFMHGNFMHIFFNMWALVMFGNLIERYWGTQRFMLYYMLCGIGAALCNSLITHIEIGHFVDAANQFINNPDPKILGALTQNYPEIFNQSAVAEFLERWQDTKDYSMLASYKEAAKNQITQIVNMRINNTCMVGASGAVFGLLLAFGMLFPNLEMYLLFIPIPIKAKYMVIGYGVLEFFYGIANVSSDNVAHFAHLGGMLIGFILIMIYKQQIKN